MEDRLDRVERQRVPIAGREQVKRRLVAHPGLRSGEICHGVTDQSAELLLVVPEQVERHRLDVRDPERPRHQASGATAGNELRMRSTRPTGYPAIFARSP